MSTVKSIGVRENPSSKSKFEIHRRCFKAVESMKSQNAVEKPSNFGDKLPVLKKHRPSYVTENQRPMKRLKTDSEVKPKLDLLKVSESKKEIQVPVQHSGNVVGSEEIPPEKTRRNEMMKHIFADAIANAQKKLGRDAKPELQGTAKPQNAVKKLSNSGYKLPASASQSKKRLKTESSGESPKSVLIKGLESKREIRVPVQHSRTVIGSTEKTRRIELKKNIFADTINIRAQVPQYQEISLGKQRQAERIAVEEMKRTVRFENAMEIEGNFMKLFGCSRGGIEKINLLVEDLEEGEIRIPTISPKTSMAANKIKTTIQINKVVHGSQSPRSVLEKERETARNVIEKVGRDAKPVDELQETVKPQNIVENLSNSGCKHPALALQSKKRLKIDSGVSPTSVLIKGSESKREIRVPVQHSGTVIGSEEMLQEKTGRIKLRKNIFADTIKIRAQVPQCREISLEKQRQAEKIAIEQMKKSVHFEHAMEIEGYFMKLFGHSRGGIEKRILTVSPKTSMASNRRTTTPQQNEEMLERNVAIQINKVVHGSQSPRNVLEKERETARNAIEKMKKTVHFEQPLEIEGYFMKLFGCSRGGKEKINLLEEDLEEGEIRIPTVSC